MVPPTPPAMLRATTRPPSGIVGTSPVRSAGTFGTVTIAAPTTVTNMSPTNTAMIFSNAEYRPNQTTTAPTRPHTMANTLRSTPGKSAASGSAEELIAAAP